MSHQRLIGLAAVALLVGACSSTTATPVPATEAPATPTPAPTEAPKLYIPIVSKGFQHQFWQAVKKGAEDQATAEGVTVNFMGPDTESNVDQQLNMLQAELAKKPAALCIAALDSKAATPLLEQYQAAKIPVIAFDSGVDSSIPLTTVATDNKAAAAVAADKLAAAIGNTGKVGLIVHDQTSRTGIDRRDGFMAQMAAKYPNIKIIGPQYGGGDQLKSADIAKAMIQANPDIKGFFAANEGSAVGVINALKELKQNGKIVLVGYDSGKAQIDAIKDGTMLGAVQQNPIGIGAKCVVYAVKAIKGETFDKTVDTGYVWADKTNLDSPEVKGVLYD